MTTIDLYTEKYLGELETILIEKNSSGNIVFKIRLFSAIFESILDYIPYEGNSHHESVIYLFHTGVKNWGDDFSLANRLEEFYDQLLSIAKNRNIDENYIDEYKALKQICLSTLQNRNNLYVKLYD